MSGSLQIRIRPLYAAGNDLSENSVSSSSVTDSDSFQLGNDSASASSFDSRSSHSNHSSVESNENQENPEILENPENVGNPEDHEAIEFEVHHPE